MAIDRGVSITGSVGGSLLEARSDREGTSARLELPHR